MKNEITAEVAGALATMETAKENRFTRNNLHNMRSNVSVVKTTIVAYPSNYSTIKDMAVLHNSQIVLYKASIET